jgi:hypothetical protein
MLALVVSPAVAQPITADGDLSEWGLDPGNSFWVPGSSGSTSLTNVAWVYDDDITQAWDSGREWYDIEALYLDLWWDEDSNQYLSWAMITSYPGMEPSGSGAVSYREGTNPGETVDYAYSRHPFLALRFNSSTTWDYGVIMAPSTTSEGHPLDDIDRVSNDDSWASGDTGTGLGTVSDTPELWDVYTGSDIRGTWREGSSRGYGTASYDADTPEPVDFDPTQTSLNTLLDNSGSAWAGRINGISNMTNYTEPNLPSPNSNPQNIIGQLTQAEGKGWLQQDNFVWEGWVKFPTSAEDFDEHTTISFFCATWCTNNTTFGDGIEYGFPRDDAPELGTWALLLCTGALGGWVRRRRRE